MGDAYTGERLSAGQLVYGPDGDTLDKHTDVVRINAGGFDWGEDAPEGKLLQLTVALLADHVNEEIAEQYHHGFAAYLDERLSGDTWSLDPGEIRQAHWTMATDFENRALDEDPLADDGADDTDPSGDERATADAVSGPSTRNGADIGEVATTAVEEALADAAENVDEGIDYTAPEPPEAVVGALRAQVGLLAAGEPFARDDLKELAFAELEARFGAEQDGDRASATTPDEPDQSADDQFQFLDSDDLESTANA